MGAPPHTVNAHNLSSALLTAESIIGGLCVFLVQHVGVTAQRTCFVALVSNAHPQVITILSHAVRHTFDCIWNNRRKLVSWWGLATILHLDVSPSNAVVASLIFCCLWSSATASYINSLRSLALCHPSTMDQLVTRIFYGVSTAYQEGTV